MQAIAEPTDGIIAQPLLSLWKSWGNDAGQIAAYSAMLWLPWAIKPLYGLLTDFVPLFGRQRQGYLLATSAAGCASLLALWGLDLAQPPVGLMWLLMLATTSVAFADVVIDAVMVEQGQPTGLTGRFQAMQWGAVYGSAIVIGPAGGYLCQHGQQRVGFLIAGLAMLVMLILALVAVRDRPSQPREGQFRQTAHLLRQAIFAPTILAVAGFLFFWSFNPFSVAVLYLHVTRHLGVSEQFYGHIMSIEGGAAAVGSLLYGFYCRRVPMRGLVHASIVLGIVTTAAYGWLRGESSALAVAAAVGFATGTATVIQLDLAAQVCPPQVAGTLFATLMGLSNLSTALSRALGGWFYNQWLDSFGEETAFNLLVAAGSVSTAGCWLVVPFLNRTLPPAPAASNA